MSRLLAEIEAILAEPIATARERERRRLSARLASCGGQVVLFGAGRLGRLCARALAVAGTPVLAFCDSDAGLQGGSIAGVPVMKPEEAARRFGASALFIVTTWSGTAREGVARRQGELRGWGCQAVESFAPVLWACLPAELPFHACDLPSRELARAADYRRLAERLGDEESRRVLLVALRQRITGEFTDDMPRPDQYFPRDLIRPRADEQFVDGGAFDGDTLAAFLAWTGGRFEGYHAFEPDPANVSRLQARVAALPPENRGKIMVHPVALHSREEPLDFVGKGEVTSRIEAVPDSIAVTGRRLDDVLGAEPATFVKLDVEGAEASALAGAARTLSQHQPVAAICVYHRPEDLTALSLRLADALPEHLIFLRAHGCDGWEMVSYAIPAMRREPPRRCPVCGAAGPREPLHHQAFEPGPLGSGYDVVVCGDCGAAFADGIPSQRQLDDYYAERSKYTYAHAGGAESPFDFARFERIADQIEQHIPSKAARILDVGCATGGLLAVLKRRGYANVLGSDPSPACAEAAHRLHGIEVRTATLAEHAGWDERFDAVLLVGVLEHVREVRAALETVRGLLAVDGLVYCAQPDVGSFAECRNAPYQQFSTEHINFFSRVSLNNLMAAAGMGPVALWPWMVEWREGITDSVISGVFCRRRTPSLRDELSRPALLRYIAASRVADETVRAKIQRLAETQEPVIVWGAGTATRRLLAMTRLARCRIECFVDSNPALRGTELAGIPVVTPADASGRREPVVICSQVFAAEIRRTIAQLGWRNEVRLFFDETPL